MAKLQDKFFNRVIEGDLELGEKEKSELSAILNDIASYDELVKVINGSFQNDFLQGLTLVESYCKVVRNFNELQFICNFRVKNNTESAITLLSDTMIAYYNVPEELQSKIYAHNGNACSRNESSSQGSIAMATLIISQESGATDANGPRYANLYHYQGLIRFYLEGGNFSVGAGELRDFEARISLAL